MLPTEWKVQSKIERDLCIVKPKNIQVVMCCNINLWVPLCGVPYVFVGRPTSREHVSWLMSDIVLTVFNVALSI